MIFRASRLSHLRLTCPAFRHREPLPLYAERVSASFSTFLGRCTSGSRGHGSYITPIICRNYADNPVSRPKAHTGRTTTAPSKKAATATKSTSEKVKAKRKRKPKTKAKTTSRSKTKAKSKPRSRRKKILTEEQKEALAAKMAKRKEKLAANKAKQKIKDLKTAALQNPPRRPVKSPWVAFLADLSSDPELAGKPRPKILQEGSVRYKALSPERREHYNRVALQRAASVEVEYRQWVESHTPEQIRLANIARRTLSMKGLKKYAKLIDKRQVKRPRQARNFFFSERYASDEYGGINAPQRAILMSKEWSALPAADKKKFGDMAVQDYQRFVQETKAVYNRDVPLRPQSIAAAVAI